MSFFNMQFDELVFAKWSGPDTISISELLSINNSLHCVQL